MEAMTTANASSGATGPSERTEDPDVFRIAEVPIHLGLGATARPLLDFGWSPEQMAAYGASVASDGDEGRLVLFGTQSSTWDSWERHPAGEEVVLLLSGRVDVIQELDGEHRRIELHPGEYAVNPPGIWHTADVIEPGDGLFITPGRGTEHRPR
jgi:quercetin dioxygenase-like cupin family protein